MRSHSIFLVALLAVATATGTAVAGTTTTHSFNCKSVNKTYHHGVGLPGARDRTKSGKPVTNFVRNRKLYLRYKSLDRDRDGIACEKH